MLNIYKWYQAGVEVLLMSGIFRGEFWARNVDEFNQEGCKQREKQTQE